MVLGLGFRYALGARVRLGVGLGLGVGVGLGLECEDRLQKGAARRRGGVRGGEAAEELELERGREVARGRQVVHLAQVGLQGLGFGMGVGGRVTSRNRNDRTVTVP